jgi:hypothetical protein
MGYGFGSEKHRLLWLLNKYRLSMISLARKANVPVSTVQSMAWGIAVRREIAEHVLAVLSRMTQVNYTLDQVDIVVFIEGSCNPGSQGEYR